MSAGRGEGSLPASRPAGDEIRPGLGVLLAVLTAMLTAVGYIAAKPVLERLDPLSFSVAQFTVATAASMVWIGARREVGRIRELTPGLWAYLFLVSLLFLGAIYTMWLGLSRIPVTSTSLLNRLEVLVTVLLGMALLGDRFTPRETLGALLTVGGVIVLRFQALPGFSTGFWMMVLSSFLFGTVEFLVKLRARVIPTGVFVLVRNAMVLGMFLVAAGWLTTSRGSGAPVLDLPGIRRDLLLIVTVALAGPVLARTTYIRSLRHLEVSRTALVNQSQPVFVALLSALLLGADPSPREWTGGVLIVAGCLLLIRWARRREPRRIPPAA